MPLPYKLLRKVGSSAVYTCTTVYFSLSFLPSLDVILFGSSSSFVSSGQEKVTVAYKMLYIQSIVISLCVSIIETSSRAKATLSSYSPLLLAGWHTCIIYCGIG